MLSGYGIPGHSCKGGTELTYRKGYTRRTQTGFLLETDHVDSQEVN